MSGSTANAAAVAATAAASVCVAPELKIGTQKFDSDQEKARGWLLATTSYLDINTHCYTTDQQKVIFALALMYLGPATVWAEEFMAHAQTIVTTAARTQAAHGYGMWAQFKTAFKENFGQIDLTGNAITRLRQLKQKPNKLSEYVAEFKQLSTKAGLTTNLPYNQFFLDGLQQGLLNHFY